jgi:MFS family permease
LSARLRYAAVLRSPYVARLLTTALISRAPVGVNGLAIVLFMRAETGSYATAGAVAGFYAVGAAIVAPFLGRLVDRTGAPRVLLPLAIAHGVFLGALVGLGVSGAANGWLFLCAFAAGSAIPPVGSVLRALWPRLMADEPDLLTTAYALDSVIVEVAFVIGPLVVGLVAAVASPQLALLAAIGLVIAGTAAFTANAPVRAYDPGGDHAHDTGGRLGALRSPGVRTLVATTLPIGFCVGAAEVAFPAFGESLGSPALAGPLIAIWSLGSACGGLFYGAHAHRVDLTTAYLRTLAIVPLVTLPLALPSSFAVMAPLALLSGIAIAPLIAAGSQLVGQVAPQGALTEAYTWPLTSLVGGVAAGNAASGGIVASIGWREAFIAAAAVGAFGIAVGFVRRATLRPAVAAP